MEFDKLTFNKVMNIEKSMKGNQVSLIVKPDLDQPQKPIFELVVTSLENACNCLTSPQNVW